MGEKKKFTLVGYSETDYGEEKPHLKSVKLIYTDEEKKLYHGIFADDETTITFIKWSGTYYPISTIKRELCAGDLFIAGYIFENQIQVGTIQEIRERFAELRTMKSVSSGELYDVGCLVKNAESIIAGIRGMIEENKDIKFTYKNFYIPKECEEEVEKAFKK